MGVRGGGRAGGCAPRAGRLGKARLLSMAHRIEASTAKNQSPVPGVSLRGISQQKTITENKVKAQTRFHTNQKGEDYPADAPGLHMHAGVIE